MVRYRLQPGATLALLREELDGLDVPRLTAHENGRCTVYTTNPQDVALCIVEGSSEEEAVISVNPVRSRSFSDESWATFQITVGPYLGSPVVAPVKAEELVLEAAD